VEGYKNFVRDRTKQKPCELATRRNLKALQLIKAKSPRGKYNQRAVKKILVGWLEKPTGRFEGFPDTNIRKKLGKRDQQKKKKRDCIRANQGRRQRDTNE